MDSSVTIRGGSRGTTYLGELRPNARPLAAASLGCGVGLILMSYASTIFGPYLVREFGWSRSQFALIGLAMVSTLVALPFIGRLTDRIGVRRAAIVGALGIPLCLLAYSLMNGNFFVYFLISSTLSRSAASPARSSTPV